MENIFSGLSRLLLGLSCPPGCQSLGHTEEGTRAMERILERLGPLQGFGLMAGFGLGPRDLLPGDTRRRQDR